MSTALAVFHGSFGRTALYLLDREMVTHAHREGHLTFHIKGHSADVSVSEKMCVLSSETAIAINPWEPHTFDPHDHEHGTLVLTLYIKPEWFLETSHNGQSSLRFGQSRIEMNDYLRLKVRRIADLLLHGEATDLVDGYLYELTQSCFEQSWKWSSSVTVFPNSQHMYSDFRVRRAISLMKENISSNMALETIARESGLSRPHFYKLFRKQTGVTPNLYFNTLRLETALDSLIYTKKSVIDISFDLGYASPASFARFFSSNVGIPPSNYRRVAQG